jgi:hypothetical protein
MDINKIQISLIELLVQFLKENEIDLDEGFVVDENTRLIGTTSIFDSMELVQFIVEVESLLDENFDLDIELTSEKAMSRRSSPFISLKSLSEYITDESN